MTNVNCYGVECCGTKSSGRRGGGLRRSPSMKWQNCRPDGRSDMAECVAPSSDANLTPLGSPPPVSRLSPGASRSFASHGTLHANILILYWNAACYCRVVAEFSWLFELESFLFAMEIVWKCADGSHFNEADGCVFSVLLAWKKLRLEFNITVITSEKFRALNAAVDFIIIVKVDENKPEARKRPTLTRPIRINLQSLWLEKIGPQSLI